MISVDCKNSVISTNRRYDSYIGVSSVCFIMSIVLGKLDTFIKTLSILLPLMFDRNQIHKYL